ncbi:MAG TPA: tetratricopeptide repeat protein [Actinomycetota bacterium]|nr:tetratricopeptide repeat protein [Actinomycetota bacterium]
MKRAVPALGGIAALAVVLLALGALQRVPESTGQAAPKLGTDVSSGLLVPQPTRDLGEAIASLEARIDGGAGDWRSYATLGLAYLQKGTAAADPTYYEKAQTALKRSLEIKDSDNFEAFLGLGVLANARHDFAEGLEWGRKAALSNPSNAQARAVSGDALTELGRYGEAIDILQEMVDLRPSMSAYARVSYARELHGDVSGARRAMEMALDSAGSSSDGAWAAYQLGELHFNNGRVAEAEHEYRRALYLAPGYAPARAGLAKIIAAKRRPGEAIAILKPATTRYPSPELVILLGDLYRLDGRDQQAQRQYALLQAIQRLYRANRVNNDLELSLFNSDHGLDTDRALRLAQAEYARRQSVHVADALGWALYANDRFSEARRFSREALRLGTRNALFHFHAGMIELELNHREQARVHLRKALDINPHFSFLHAATARDALEELGGAR